MVRFRIFPGPRSAKNHHVVQKIPQEIAELIFSLLTAPDQVCFSLSCKHLFVCLHLYLKAQQQGMKLPQLLPSERRPAILCPDAQKRLRIQLLLRLENDRWKYCGECWSLHSHSTWRALRANWRLLLRQIQYDYGYRHPEQICSIVYAGEVDLCPCLTITFRDKLHLIEKCRQLKQTTEQGKKKYCDLNDVDKRPNFGTRHKGIYHVCTFTDHPFGKVEVTTVITTRSLKGTSLLVCNRYKFIFNPQGQRNNINNNNSSHQTSCPHPHGKSTRTWLEKFFHEEAGSSFLGWDKKNNNHHRSSRPPIYYDWGECNCQERSIIGDAVDEQCSQQLHSFELKITRNLGNDKWPNKIWSHHRRK